MAIHNYESGHGNLPPAFMADKNGKPMHSWRILILPYLGYEDLYRRYDFSEPWNGPNNRLLAKEMPVVYRCPSARPGNPLTTNYVAIVGDDTMWPGEKTVSIKDITDGSTSTLMIVEVADSDIHWMEPRDMTVGEAIAGVNVDRRRGISSNHPGGAYCEFLYGHGFLPDGTSPEVLKALLTKDGGEPVWESESGEWILQRP